VDKSLPESANTDTTWPIRQIKNVANSSDRPYMRWSKRVDFDLCAKSTNMYLKIVSRADKIRTPCVVQQFSAADDPAGIVHQVLQNYKFLMWQVHQLSSDDKPVAIKMQLDVADSQESQPTETPGIDRKVRVTSRCGRRAWSLH
jgi:hypothetical protein